MTEVGERQVVDNRLCEYGFPLRIGRTDLLMRGKEGRAWEMRSELMRPEGSHSVL